VRRIYDGAAAYADAQFGMFMGELQARGLLDEAWVIVMADHGEELGEDGVFNHRHRLSPQTLHVPLMVRLPGAQAGGRRVGEPVALLDLMPTLLELANAAPPASMRGQSLLPVLRGGTAPRREALFAENAWRQVAVHDGAEGTVFAGISPHSPFLQPVLAAARVDGPAFQAWPETPPRALGRFKDLLLDWRRQLPPTPGPQQRISPERMKQMREQGYWEAP